MELEELLLSMAVRAAVSGVRALFAQNPAVAEAAIDATSKQFPDMELGRSLERWVASPAFDDFIARVHAGERHVGDDVVASFIEIGEFDHGDEREERAREVVSAFLGNVLSELHRSEAGISVLENHQKRLYLDAREHANERFDRIEDLIVGMSSPIPVVSLAESEQHEPADTEQTRVEARLDLARDLLEDNMVDSARVVLERLQEEIPDDLQYRLLTLFGACALAAEAVEEGCDFIEEALGLRPDEAAALANAAVVSLLRGNPRRAVALARRSLDLEPRDPQAAAVLVEALWKAGEADQMEEFVAAEAWISSEPRCVLALARIRAEQERFDDALELARWLVDDDADDSEARTVLAECLVLVVQAGLAEEPVALCLEAEEHATEALALLEGTELRVRVRHVSIVRAGARLFAGDFMRAMDDVEAVLRACPSDPTGLYTKGRILFEADDFWGAVATFDLIEDSQTRARALVPHAAAKLWSDDQPGVIELLRGNFSLHRRAWDDIGMAELLGEAEHALGAEDTVGPPLEEALQRTPEQPRLQYLAARRHALRGEDDAAETCFLRALDRAEDYDRDRIRLGLAAFYSRQERYSDAADQCEQAVDGDVLHPGVIELLRNLWNSRRLREALAWARTLREQHPHAPKYALETEARILNYVGDVTVATERWAAICSREDSTPRDHLILAMSLLWCGEREKALAVVRDIDASELHSEPRDLLWLAQLKQLLGEVEFLDDAYAARRCGFDDASVHHGYFGLCLSKEGDLATPQTVEPGCAVLLRRDSHEDWWLVLEEGEERRSDHDLRPTDKLAVALRGHRRGDAVLLQEGVSELSVVVVDIQSKYVRAFQETTSQFPERFPGNTDITSVAVSPDDMSSFFRVVDDRDRLARELQRLYRDNQVPFAFLCAYLGRPAPEVWRACTADGGLRIRFGTGAEAETDRAQSELRESDGIVLDMLALLTVHDLGLAEDLRRRFGRIAIPQTVLDELRQLVYEATSPKQPRGYVGKALDGSYSWVELSNSESVEHAEFAQSLLKLAESFEAIPSYPLLDVAPDTLELFSDALGNAGLATVFAGGEDPADRPLLVSDDLGLATLARVLGAGAVNTQAVLLELRRSGELTDEQYSVFVARLAQLHYRFVRVEAADITRLLETNGYMTGDASRALLGTLEGPECSLESAVRVVAELIAEIGLRHPPNEALIIPALLAALHRGREMTTALWECRAEIESRLRGVPPVRARVVSFVDQWTAVWASTTQ